VYLTRPVEIVRSYKLEYLPRDVIAGLTVAVVTLPQAMAYALIAELPPQAGLYAAIIGGTVGALWGACNQLVTGPSNAASLLVLSTLLPLVAPGTPEYAVAAGMMALLVGLFRLLMGVARLGMLVNFVSDSVVVGFTAGAGILILVNQVRHLLRLPIPSMPNLWQTLPAIVAHLPEMHLPSLLVGAGTSILIVVLRRVNRKIPGPLVGMIAAAAVVALLRLDAQGVRVVGELPRSLPPFSPLPLFDVDLLGKLMTGSLAVAAIGLVEVVSITHSIASHTGQRLDSNQEFVGQGLANIASGFFSGYTCSGSFVRSAVNHEAGARTAFASVCGSLFVLLVMIALAPLAAYVPLTGLAGVLFLTAYRLIDRREMVRIWRSSRSDRLIMVATLLATLALPLQFAVISGILLSLIVYLVRTSTPRVRTVLPDKDFRHLTHRPDAPACPQLAILEILGDLYFGATSHIEDQIRALLADYPGQRYLLLRLQAVDHCDISGIHTLESIVRLYRDGGGDVYLTQVRGPVRSLMRASGFEDDIGADHFLDQDEAISYLFYHVLDPAICIYECPVRAFRECQNLPKPDYTQEISLPLPETEVPVISPHELWQALRSESPPLVVDVREPREFRSGHVPGARSLPLPSLLRHMDQVPYSEPVVIVCRGGRRSTRAAALLRTQGRFNVRILQGGMIAWEDARLLEAIEA